VLALPVWACVPAGLEYESFGEAEMPIGSLRQELEESSRLEVYAAFERALGILKRETTALYHDVPEKARRYGVEIFLIDQVCDAAAPWHW